MTENIVNNEIHRIIRKKNELIFETLRRFNYTMYDIISYKNYYLNNYHNIMTNRKISFNKKTKRILLLKTFCSDVTNEIISYL